MIIEAYTLPGCSSCGQLKKLFDRASVEYKEVMLRRDMTVDEFSSYFPGVNSFPFVVIDGEKIGGLVETAKLFVSKGLVSSKKQ